MVCLWTICAVFLILIGVNICIFIGKKAYRTHVLLKNTASYILLQYGVGVLVVYLLYLEIMSAFGVDARPSITRELILWSALTMTTASVSYVLSKLAVVPGDGMLYHIHNVLLHRIVDGTRPEAWRSTMRQFEIELSKATRYKVYGHMLPKCLQYNTSSVSGTELKPKGSRDLVRRINSASEDVLQRAISGVSLKKPKSSILSLVDLINSKMMAVVWRLYETAVPMLPVVIDTIVTAMKHFWIRLSGIRITFGSVDEYYKEMNVDRRARIPNRSVPPLMKSKHHLNLEEFCSYSDSSVTSLQ